MRQARVCTRNGFVGAVVHAIGAPFGARCNDHARCAVVEYGVGGHRLLSQGYLALIVLFDELFDLGLAIIAMEAPLAEPWQGCNVVYIATDLISAVDEVDGIATFHKDARAFRTGRTRANDQVVIL